MCSCKQPSLMLRSHVQRTPFRNNSLLKQFFPFQFFPLASPFTSKQTYIWNIYFNLIYILFPGYLKELFESTDSILA